jgi:hypothetical protein
MMSESTTGDLNQIVSDIDAMAVLTGPQLIL